MESEIELLKNKKILQYPLGLGSSAVDDYGDAVQYMLFKISQDENTSRLRDDASLGTVQSATRQGTGVAVSKSKNTDPDLIIANGKEATSKETFYEQKNMVRLDRVIVLPMPNDHNLKTSIVYAEVNQTLLTKGADMLNASKGALASELATLGISKGVSALASRVSANLTNTTALLGASRLAINPKQEVMFTSFNRRDFQFIYQFAPKSKVESDMVNEIIESFRYYSLPEISLGKIFYRFPAEFEISFMLGQEDNANIPKISTCVLRSVNVNYSPNGVWATLPNGSPVALTMSLDFGELELIDRKRVYDKESEITSGY